MKRICLNQAGQATIESILIATVLLGIVTALGQQFQSGQTLQTAGAGPWTYVRGMIEDGVWAPPATAALSHPNLKKRHASNAVDSQEDI